MIQFQVNGARHTIDAEPERSLLTILRDEIGITGTKYGCGEGQCGACTVWIDGSPMRSCQARSTTLAGRNVTTIEAIEEKGRLHPLQEAFLESSALQCGYCTPGMIMSGVALLKKNANPTRADIVTAMQGNVCRCGAYPQIVRAVQVAATKIRGARA
jgi:aerobic-type carbon monoxide dehydrogenase small subunit (CoxS/CutS family)